MTIKDVKPAIERRAEVVYNGKAYTLQAYTLRNAGGRIFHQFELLDKNQNSLVIADMGKVEIASE